MCVVQIADSSPSFCAAVLQCILQFVVQCVWCSVCHSLCVVQCVLCSVCGGVYVVQCVWTTFSEHTMQRVSRISNTAPTPLARVYTRMYTRMHESCHTSESAGCMSSIQTGNAVHINTHHKDLTQHLWLDHHVHIFHKSRSYVWHDTFTNLVHFADRKFIAQHGMRWLRLVGFLKL